MTVKPNLRPKSETLFHFTPKLDYLKGIIKTGFIPRICHEDISYFTNGQKFSVPMVCFCDIPLSRLSEHTEYYGSYGIGLTKAWAIESDIHPINYGIKSSPTTEVMNFLLDELKATPDTEVKRHERLHRHLCRLFAYAKPMNGVIGRRNPMGEIKNVFKDFYQENEWRYSPRKYKVGDLSKKPTELAEANARYAEEPIQFSPSDIRYIIVKSEDEIHQISQFITTHFEGLGTSGRDINILRTRILCLDSIVKDV